jgi:hypothetical protein
MKKLTLVFLLFLFGLSACAPAVEASPTSTPLPSSTASRTPLPTATQIFTLTVVPTETPVPLTPTLDVASLVTFTPAPYAACPQTDDSLRLQMRSILENPLAESSEISGAVLDFLNGGGTLKAAYEGLTRGSDFVKVFTVDITNDRMPELVLQKHPYLLIFGCEDGAYNVIFEKGGNAGDIVLYSLKDLNLNGIPEIIYRENDHLLGFLFNPRYSFYFFEWDGQEFQNILSGDKIFEMGLEMGEPHRKHGFNIAISGVDVTTDDENKNKWMVGDFDNNGISDIRIIAGIPVTMDGQSEFPERQTILTLSWNGKQYIPANLMSKAVFRIDVARDADAAFLSGDYENALSLYQIVLQNDSLLEWEHPLDRSEGIIDRFAARNRMSAYAYYRLTLVYLAQNNSEEAAKAYDELQSKYGSDEVTRPYAEMAKKFWDTYQSSMNLGDACKQAVAFAESEPVVLSPFDNVFDDVYSPADICPVK